MRTRLRAAVAAMVAGVVVAGCGTVPGDAAATVNGEAIPLDLLDEVVGALTQNAGLRGTTLDRVDDALEVGLYDRSLLMQQLVGDPGVSSGGITLGLVELADESLDEWFAAHRDAAGDAYEDLLARAGMSEATWRATFDDLVLAQAAAFTMGQQAPSSSLDVANQYAISGAIPSLLSTLVNVEIIDQAAREHGIEVTDEDLDQYMATTGAQVSQLVDAGLSEQLARRLSIQPSVQVERLTEAGEDLATLQADADVAVAQRLSAGWDPVSGQALPPELPVEGGSTGS